MTRKSLFRSLFAHRQAGRPSQEKRNRRKLDVEQLETRCLLSTGTTLFSDAFSGNTLGSAWRTVSGTWSESPGVLSQTSTANADPRKAMITGLGTQPVEEIVAEVRVNSWISGDLARAGVGLFTNTSNGDGYNLVFHNNTNTVQFLDDKVTWGNSYTFNWTVGTWYWFALQEKGGVLNGKIWANGTAEPTQWMFQQTGWTDRGSSGVPALNGGSAGTADGSTTDSFANVSVINPDSSPIVSSGGPYSGTAGTAINFNKATVSDSTPGAAGAGYTYLWTFGDGTSSTNSAPAHVYSKAGTYNVQLTVTSELDGLTGSTTTTATATGSPLAQVFDGSTAIVDGSGSDSFGSTSRGTPISKTFTVKNGGTASLTLGTAITLPTGFTLTSGFGSTTLAVGASTTFTVQMTAAVAGSYSGTVSFTTNDTANNPFTFTISGTATAPLAQVFDGSTAIVDGTGSDSFGSTSRGTPVSKTFTVKNGGTASLTLGTAITLPTGFTPTSGFGSNTLAAGASTTFTVQMTAAAAGNYSGTVSFTTNDTANNPYTFTISGTVTAPLAQVFDGSTAITDGAGSDSFGSTPVGTPVSKTFTVKNAGTASLTLGSSITLPSGFTLTSGFGSTTLAAGASTTFTVQMTASSAGSPSGTVSFTTNDTANNPYTFTISGTVTSSSSGTAQIIDDSSASGFSTIGTWNVTTTQGFDGNNHWDPAGTGSNVAIWTFAVTPGQYSVSATWPGNSWQTTNAPFTVFNGSTALSTVTVNQAVAPNGPLSQGVNWQNLGTFTITGNTLVVKLTDNANGIVVADAISVVSVGASQSAPTAQVLDGTTAIADGSGSDSFGSTTVGTPVSKTFTVKNAGTVSLTLGSSITLPSGFTLTSGFGSTTLAAGASTTFTVQMAAATAGSYSGTVSFTTNDTSNNPYTFTISGTVSVPASAIILDDSGTGFSETGTGWTGYSGGYDGEYQYTGAAPGAASASWQASGVTPSSYLVQATWNGSANHTAAAAYSIYDGSTLLQTVVVSQQQSPSGPVIGGVPFQTLANVTVTSGTIRVVVVSQSSGDLIADAVRFAPPGISPTATFTGPASVNAGTTTASVTFSNPTGGSGGYTYSYDFNNAGTFEITGSTSSTVTIPESYLDNGPSTVVVHGRVTDSVGDYTDYTTSITVNDVAPTASIILPSSRVVGTALTFSASVTDPSTADNEAGYTYSWNFGDGTSPVAGATPSHDYYNPGVYTINLTVTDKSGSVGTATATLTVVSVGYITTPYLNIPDFGYNPTIVSVQSGNWSNPATWSLDRVPQAGDIVDINPGTTVTYDVNDSTDAAPLNTVEIENNGATLKFSTTTSTQMNVVNLVVLQGGTLDIGTQANPIPANISATVVWVNQALNTTLDPEQYGNGLIALGTVNTYGAVKVPYVTLAQNANVGNTVLQLASPATGWQVGDKLQLPDTQQLDTSGTLEWESMTIQSISTNGLTITLTAPLQYSHLGAYNASGVLKYLPQVVDMTRNVSIHSQSATGTRGYALFTDHANVNINYTSFSGMGRTTNAEFLNSGTSQLFDNTTFDSSGNVTHLGTDEENRNAITFLDLVGPSSPQADGYQFTFNGNVVTCPLTPMPFIWGINVTNSYYGLIENNDVVNWNGAGVMVDGLSSYNNFTGNYVSRINGTGQRGSGDQGFGGDGFWFGNSNNYVTNNIVNDLVDNGPYGYGYEFYDMIDNSLLGYQNIAAYQGADPSQPGQSQSVDMNLLPLLSFANNEAYGVMNDGLSYWYVNNDPLHSDLSQLADGGLIQDFVTWNLSTGIYGYNASNITVNGFVDLGDTANLAAGGSWGMQFQDYFTGGMVIDNADIENVAVGVRAPVSVNGTFTVENSYLADSTGVEVDALWSVSYQATGIPPRTVVIDNLQFTAPFGGGAFTAIDMNWYNATQLTGAAPVTQLDQVLVYNYDGESGDNFQVFYTQQAASFIVPQTQLNSDGTVRIMGAPVAGLTNAQAWAQYGVAVAGGVASSDATTMDNIIGLVAPI